MKCHVTLLSANEPYIHYRPLLEVRLPFHGGTFHIHYASLILPPLPPRVRALAREELLRGEITPGVDRRYGRALLYLSSVGYKYRVLYLSW